ncbi:uncharacterized protein LOC133321012 [Musca vetustissima]|uniref:uncharacterized protein LOC133321012 n=1 Tax=Musca vetustissima TaxID=27455 RepID=UPI002AB7AB05|nr:uncharacterized protein LOC133321012 [Musca vetustissima]
MAPNSNDTEIINPNEYLSIPEWINEAYFTPILEKDVENFKETSKFKAVAATAPGENYTSIMVRVVIDVILTDGAAKQVSYILKTVLESGNQSSEFVKSMNLFPKEMKMYSDYLAKFEKLYKEAGVEIQLAPKCLHCEDTPERTVLVMEDLSREKFKNMDRLKGFDSKYSRLVLEKLAELHAASAVCDEVNGPYDEIFHRSFISDANKHIFAAMYPSRTHTWFKAMREWGLEEMEKFEEKKLDFETYYNVNININKVNPDEFNVLNHGDMWVNNIMFSHDDENGDVKKSLLVDFQLCKWGSPTQDLWYFLTTSVQVDIRAQEFDSFIATYHKRLVECLKLLKYSKKIPSLKEMHIMMIKNSYWAQFTAMSVTGNILFPNDKDANMENMLKMGPEADAFRHKVLTSPVFVNSMLQWFPFIYNKGAFDV